MQPNSVRTKDNLTTYTHASLIESVQGKKCPLINEISRHNLSALYCFSGPISMYWFKAVEGMDKRKHIPSWWKNKDEKEVEDALLGFTKPEWGIFCDDVRNIATYTNTPSYVR